MPETPPLPRRLMAETIGCFFLFAAVVGSGIMAERLAGGNTAVALLGNTLATGAMLFVLIATLGPVSGAHLNPAVSLVAVMRRELAGRDAIAYAVAQLAGGILGVWAAHAMFGLPLWQLSTNARTGGGQWFAGGIATFGLVLTVIGSAHRGRQWVPAAVALYIAGAYWFTASASFANPAITVARSLSDSFAGIAPADTPAFIAAQLAGAPLASVVAPVLFQKDR